MRPVIRWLKEKSTKQVRASVIVKWLKMYNLREARYLAGHRYVSSTEKYKQNDLEGLQEEVQKSSASLKQKVSMKTLSLLYRNYQTMDIQTRKLNFIQEVLAVSNEKIIDKLEALLRKERKKNIKSPSVYDLLGVLSEEEAEQMKKEIEASCETIHEEDWK